MIVYFDCFSGASGDMLLGALVDAGAPEAQVRRSLDGLALDGWELRFEPTTRAGMRATRALVNVNDGAERTYRDILALLDRAELSQRVAGWARDAFDLLARAEGRVHDVAPSDVHFHEVGALDAIIDVVGCCAALAQLDPDRIVTSPIATGTGTVDSAHGMLPLPAPAVTEILARRGAVLFGRGRAELVTPTGAALLAAVTDDFGTLPAISIERIGYGAGKRVDPDPNLVRVLLGREAPESRSHPSPGGTTVAEAVLVEANVDDMSPELVPHLIERLLESGADDAWVTPTLMKKGRPAYTVSALAAPDRRTQVAAALFEEATTFGIRWTGATKEMLDRRWIETSVEGETVRVKIAERDGRITTVAPEHDDARAAARALGWPLRQVYRRALEAAHTELEHGSE